MTSTKQRPDRKGGLGVRGQKSAKFQTMNISIIGGGPAGLYFAILMRQASPASNITVYERNGPDDTFGWGVVFSGKTLANLRAADAPSHAEITRDFEAWDNVDVLH